MKKCKICKIIGWVLAGLTALLLTVPAISKVILSQESVSNFQFMHLSPYLQLVGVLELTGLVLLLIPRTVILGAILLGSIMSGAVVAHLSLMNGNGVLFPIIIGSLSWLSYLFREKKVLCFKKCNLQQTETKTSHL